MPIYTGIGSRETPPEVLEYMTAFGQRLATLGWTLRSGGAPGADQAFETGALNNDGAVEIYLPWKNFRKNPSPLFDVCEKALQYAEVVWNETRSRPEFMFLKRPVKLLMARNCYQVLGPDLLTPSDFVLCWTPDGCISGDDRKPKTGGTGQAIALASKVFVPVINLANYPTPEVADIFLEDLINGSS